MAPLVSVVIPTYNSSAHLEATIRSVLDQTLDDIEIVVSDHASRDGTWELLQEHRADPRLRLNRISAGGGARRNWTHVSELATGAYVKLVCADDLLHPDCLARQVAALERAGEGAVMAACRRDIVDAAGRRVVRDWGMQGLSGEVTGGEVARRIVRAGTNLLGEPACVLFRREALQRAGYWFSEDGYVIDVATYLRVLEQGDLVAVPETLAGFRLSAEQWSVRLERQQVRQVKRLLRETASRWPEAVSARDLRYGLVAAELQAVRRRIAYRVLSRRMRSG